MKIDKRLFKALRAGGIGHQLALELADGEGPYGISQDYGYYTDGPYKAFILGQRNAASSASIILARSYLSPHDTAAELYAGLTAIEAGGAISVDYDSWDGAAAHHPNGDLAVHFTKLADANGIPVALTAGTTLSVTRASGTWGTLPGASGGWTPSAVSTQLRFTQATAGFYRVDANFWES